LKVALCHDEAIYYTEYNSLVPQLLDKLGAEYKQIDSYDNYLNKTLEVVVAGDISENVRFIRERMSFPYAFGLSTAFYKSHGHGGIYYVEVRRKGVDKGSGLIRLAKYYKFKISQCAVMGDWYNDIGMFKTKALKIAVANAVPEIKRMADHITKRTNDEDATAEFLEMVLIAKESEKPL
jgi:hydroxymethylpyrimidine pyrophosphatase-like HAD family hydrolase